MNRITKLGVAAFVAAATALSSFAESNEDGIDVVGYTPVAFGIASPVQLPWGHCNWDVFGLDLNLLYSGSAKVYGLGIGGLANQTVNNMYGVEIGGLLNYNRRDVGGVRVTCGANVCMGTVYGVDIGLFGLRKDVWGLDISAIGSLQDNITGVQIGGLANVARVQSYGWNVAVGVNLSPVAYGWQLAGILNMTEELHGCQLGLVNYADNCEWGFQIGLVNIIMSNKIKVLPIVNAYF